MRRQILGSLIALVAAVSFAPQVRAQSQGSSKPAASSKTWTMPRTPDGKPDLQGVYTNAQTIPLERPAYLGAKEYYTDEADKEASAQAARGGRGGAVRGAAEGVEEPRRPIPARSPSTMTTASSASADPRS